MENHSSFKFCTRCRQNSLIQKEKSNLPTLNFRFFLFLNITRMNNKKELHAHTHTHREEKFKYTL